VVNINNFHNSYGGFGPLREGPHAYSNVDRAFSDERVRGGISSMQSNQFGHDRVPVQQSRVDAGTFRQASLMTGASPVSPSRESFQSTSRTVSPSSIPNRSVSNQHFFSSNARGNASVQAGRGGNDFNRGGSPAAGNNAGRSAVVGQGQSAQSSRSGWNSFGSQGNSEIRSTRNGTYVGQGGSQSREGQSDARGSYNGGSSRPTLNMQQPVVTPRSSNSYPGSYPSRAPSSGGYGAPRGGSSSAGSYPSRATPSAPSGGYHGAPSSGGYHAAPSSGGSRGSSSHGGSSGGGHSSHR
jgi:hypothetical protein